MTIRPASSEGGRRLIHLGSSVIPLCYWIAGREVGVVIILFLTIAMVGIEIARIYTTRGRRAYQRFLGSVTRPSEERRPTGATYVFIGALLTAILYSPKNIEMLVGGFDYANTIAILSMLFMSVGDSTAAFVGQRYGRIPIGSKSLEGTLACFFVCLLLTLPTGLALPVTVGGAATAALTELIPRPFMNDNLGIPVLSGGAMTLLLAAGL